MILSSLNYLTETKELNINCIVKLVKYKVVNNVEGRKIIVVLDLEVLQNGALIGHIIGNPLNFETQRVVSVTENSQSASFELNTLDKENILTKNTISGIYDGVAVGTPILQLLGKENCELNKGMSFCKATLSDGQHCSSMVVFTSNIKCLVDGGDLNINDIVQVAQYRLVQKVIIVSSLKILHRGDVVNKIGDPAHYMIKQSLTESISNPNNLDSHPGTSREYSKQSTSQKNEYPNCLPVGISSIGTLNSYSRGWKICVRVIQKTDMQIWRSGQGKHFKITLLDSSGMIIATVFNADCVKFHPRVEVGKLYYISEAWIKVANKKFSKCDNDYEINFNTNTQMILCTENIAIPYTNFSFTPLQLIEILEEGHLVDVIGICLGASDLLDAETYKDDTKMRYIHIADPTHQGVRLTLYGDEAESFDAHLNPIVAVKGAKISIFYGKKLNCTPSSIIQVNPSMADSYRIRNWYDDFVTEFEKMN